MRTMTLVGVCLIIGVAAYISFPERARTSVSPASVASDSDALLSELRSKLANAEQRSRAQARAQNGLDEKLTVLEAKLKTLEGQQKDVVDPQAAPENDEEPQISEADITDWMETQLRGSEPDRQWTEEARQQAEKAVANVPGVVLRDMECSKRFCRADLETPPNAKFSTLRQLYGPPFADSITMPDVDGHMAIYFARSGEALSELRGEALASLSE